MTVNAADHLRLARWVAARYGARDREELTGAAFLGLVRAAERHDPARGAFSSLAVLLCRQEASREVLRQRRHERRETSLYVQGEDGDEIERPDLPHVDPTAEGDALAGQLREALAMLPAREREVLALHFGLEGEPVTLAEAAELVGCSRAWAAVLEGRAIGRLRRALSRRPR